ncbi:hypothetical protein BC941DRAFT_425864 [Chlamydoabsidia padenii]|nr:hypothetical protein BC941DRAFT_425864 [Chlamydoabsidia padenii]
MNVHCESSRIEFHSINLAHDQPSSTAPRRQSGGAPIPRTQDTLASLYKRHSTLTQQIHSTRLLLEQQQTENQQTLSLATARDRANGKLERKLDRLKTTLPPDSTQPLATLLSTTTPSQTQRQKQQYSLLLEDYQHWQQRVNQHQAQLEVAKEKNLQAQQQLACLLNSNQTINKKSKRYQYLEMCHALLKTILLVKDLYVDWMDDMMTRWYWLLDDNDLVHGLPSTVFATKLGTLKEDLQHHLDQDRTFYSDLHFYLTHLATLQNAV